MIRLPAPFLSQKTAAAVISGALLTLAFPDTGWALLAWIALVPLLVSLQGRSTGTAFRSGIVMGLIHFVSLMYWIVPTLHHYGGLPLALAVPALLLLALYLSLYTGLFCAAITLFPARSGLNPLLAAAVWTGTEYLRAELFTGFPWGLAGYSQYRFLSLIQIADLTGVYGVSFLIVLVNATLARGIIVYRRTPSEWKKAAVWAGIHIGITLVFLLGAMSYGRYRLPCIASRLHAAPGTVVSVIQGNIPQSDKWNAAYINHTIETYCRLSRDAMAHRPDLIIWPETALPFYYTWDEAPSDQVNDCIRENSTWFLAGSPAFLLMENSRFQYYNRAFLINPQGQPTTHYDKIHLVPFGEYVPLGRFFPFLDTLTQAAGDFMAGPDDPAPLVFEQGRLGILICFELIFPESATRAVRRGADLLVTMTNDAWFGRTSAPLQHFSMGVFRAVENRRALARSANTGISGFIEPTGRIPVSSTLFETSVQTRTLPRLKTATVYTAVGDLFAQGCLILTGLLYAIRFLYTKKARPT